MEDVGSQLQKTWGVKDALQGFHPTPPGSAIPEWGTHWGRELKYLDIENDSSDEVVDDEEKKGDCEDEAEARYDYNAFGVRHHPFGDDDVDSLPDDDCWYYPYVEEDSDSDAHPSLFD